MRYLWRRRQGICLTVLALVIGLWTLSYLAAPGLQRTTVRSEYGVLHARTVTLGVNYGAFEHRREIEERQPTHFIAMARPIPQPVSWHLVISEPGGPGYGSSLRQLLGFYDLDCIGCGSMGSSTSGATRIPCWPVALGFSIALWGRSLLPVLFKRFRPIPEGICRECGYDLRATPERCPECGTHAAVGPAASHRVISRL